MRRQLTAREKFLLGVLAIGGTVALFALRGDGLGLGAPGGDGYEVPKPVGEAPVVRMDLLALGASKFEDSGRNLFDYYTPPPPPPPPYVAPPPPPPAPPREIPKPPPVVDHNPKPPEPKPPLPDFKYLGYLGPKDARIAVFENPEADAPLLARVGDVVQQHFKLVEFRYESVVFGYTDERFANRTTELSMEAE